MNRLDAGAQVQAGSCNPVMAALGPLDWPKNTRRQDQIGSERQLVEAFGAYIEAASQRISSLHKVKLLANSTNYWNLAKSIC